MSWLVVVAPLRPGMRDRALALVQDGPPYDLPSTGLDRHEVFVSDGEIVFVFEGDDVRAAVERLAGDPALWRAAAEWRELLAGRPRLAREAFSWPPAG